MKSLAGLERTGSVKRVVDSDESPLVQAADLIGYSVFRRQMIKYGHIVADEPFMRIVDDRSGESLTWANTPHRVRRMYKDRPHIPVTLHYALARAFVAERDREFADSYLVSVEEFEKRAAAAIGVDTPGISVLDEPSEDPLNLRR